MNCKQGDIAQIVCGLAPDDRAEKRLGALVRCVKFMGRAQGKDGFVRNAWLAEPLSPCLFQYRGSEGMMLIRDDILRPLPGLPESETTKEQQPCTA